MATESLAPVAAITNLVLGMITIWMANRGKAKESHRRFTALIIGWVFVVLAVYHGTESVMNALYPDTPITSTQGTQVNLGLFAFTGSVGLNFVVTVLFFAQALLNVLMLVLALHLPHDLGKGRVWNAGVLGLILLYGVVLPPLVVMSGFRMAVVQTLLWTAIGLYWLHTYIRAVVDEHRTGSEAARSTSKASALLFVIWLGPTMIWWLSAFTFLNNEWFVSVLIGMEESPSLPWLVGINLGWSIGAIGSIVLTAGEVFRCVNRGVSTVSIIVFSVVMIGFFGWIYDVASLENYYSCLEGQCTGYSPILDLLNYLTAGILVYLIKPLLLVYVMLQYNIIDTADEQNRNLVRVLVLLVLLILSSSIIEMIQSLIPIPQMVTGSLLAIGVVFLIGWEEKITAVFLGMGTKEVGLSVAGDGFDESQLRNISFVMIFLLGYAAVVSIALAASGV